METLWPRVDVFPWLLIVKKPLKYYHLLTNELLTLGKPVLLHLSDSSCFLSGLLLVPLRFHNVVMICEDYLDNTLLYSTQTMQLPTCQEPRLHYSSRSFCRAKIFTYSLVVYMQKLLTSVECNACILNTRLVRSSCMYSQCVCVFVFTIYSSRISDTLNLLY